MFLHYLLLIPTDIPFLKKIEMAQKLGEIKSSSQIKTDDWDINMDPNITSLLSMEGQWGEKEREGMAVGIKFLSQREVGRCLWGKGEREKGMTALRRALSSSSSSSLVRGVVWMELGVMYGEVGGDEGSEMCFKTFLGLMEKEDQKEKGKETEGVLGAEKALEEAERKRYKMAALLYLGYLQLKKYVMFLFPSLFFHLLIFLFF